MNDIDGLISFSALAHDIGNFTEEYLDYINKVSYENKFRRAKEKEDERNRQAELAKRLPRYKDIIYNYITGDKIVVYDDERLEFGYIVKIKFKKTEPQMAVLVIRLTDRRIVFALIPQLYYSGSKDRPLPWLRFSKYENTQDILNRKWGVLLDSDQFHEVGILEYKVSEMIAP